MDAGPSGPHVALGEDVAYTSIIGTTCAAGALRIADRCGREIQVLGSWQNVAK